MARKINGIKVYYLKKIFLHNKIHFKIHSIIYYYCIRVYIYKVITVVITR